MRREPHVTVEAEDGIQGALRWASEMMRRGLLGGPVVLKLGRPTRSLKQNRRLWSMLTDLSLQIDWYGQKLTPEEWKDVCSAALKKQRAVPGIDGGFVVLGLRTSKMTVREMVELQDLLQAFGDQRGVKWSDPNAAP